MNDVNMVREDHREIGQYEKLVRVKVTATVEFEAYVNPSISGYLSTLGVEGRIASEIADAVEYRAPHLTDFEGYDSSDAMAVLAVPAEGDMVKVTVTEYEDLGPADARLVEQRAEGTAGEVF